MSATESDEVVGYASFLEAILSFVLLERMSERFALTQISEDLYFSSNNHSFSWSLDTWLQVGCGTTKTVPK